MADALDSGSSEFTLMQVQVLFLAPEKSRVTWVYPVALDLFLKRFMSEIQFKVIADFYFLYQRFYLLIKERLDGSKVITVRQNDLFGTSYEQDALSF